MEDKFLQYLENKIQCEEDLIGTLEASNNYGNRYLSFSDLQVAINLDHEIIQRKIYVHACKEILDLYKREKVVFKPDWDKIRSDMGL